MVLKDYNLIFPMKLKSQMMGRTALEAATLLVVCEFFILTVMPSTFDISNRTPPINYQNNFFVIVWKADIYR